MDHPPDQTGGSLRPRLWGIDAPDYLPDFCTKQKLVFWVNKFKCDATFSKRVGRMKVFFLRVLSICVSVLLN